MPRIPTTEFISNPKRYGYDVRVDKLLLRAAITTNNPMTCLLYKSQSPRDGLLYRMTSYD